MWLSIVRVGLCVLLFCASAKAQHFPMHTQTTNHLQLNNPAYAGFSGKLNGLLLSRLQWTQIDGAPTTLFLNLDGSIKEKSMGWGFQLMNDEIGPLTTMQLMGSYSYHIKAFSGKLSFGLQAGGIYQNNSWQDIETTENNDPAFNPATSSIFRPQAGFGMYWENQKLSIGIGLPWLLNQTSFYIDRKLHIFSNVAYLLKVSQKLYLKPALQVKYLPTQIAQADLVGNFIYADKVWLSIGARTNESLFAGLRVKAHKNLWVGYSFDDRINFSYSEFNASTHEVFLNFTINREKLNHRSPRYF